MTPKPQPNTLDEVFEWLDKLSELNKLGGRGHGDLKDVCYICGISPNALKVQIQALINEAYKKGFDDGVVKYAKTLKEVQEKMRLEDKDKENN